MGWVIIIAIDRDLLLKIKLSLMGNNQIFLFREFQVAEMFKITMMLLIKETQDPWLLSLELMNKIFPDLVQFF